MQQAATDPDPFLPIGLPVVPVAVACAIFLTATDRKRLKKMAWGHKSEYRQRVRAQIVLHAAPGHSNARNARETGLHLDTVRRWRRRFVEQGLAGLQDRRRSGRPSSFTPLQVVEVKALACRLPAESGVPLSRWSCPEPAREAVTRGIVTFLSASTVRRWLKTDALKPWQHHSWVFIAAPDFRPRAQRVLDPYRGHRDGRRRVRHQRRREDLRPGPLPLPPTLVPGRARAMRVNHTYRRGGALSYLAAYDVHQAKQGQDGVQDICGGAPVESDDTGSGRVSGEVGVDDGDVLAVAHGPQSVQEVGGQQGGWIPMSIHRS
nr:helix-turn-helix domain-containing protein [Streptomyces brasiliensis]